MHIHIHPLDPDCSCHIAGITSSKTAGNVRIQSRTQQIAYEELRGFFSPQYGKTSVALKMTSGGQERPSAQVSVSSVQLSWLGSVCWYWFRMPFVPTTHSLFWWPKMNPTSSAPKICFTVLMPYFVNQSANSFHQCSRISRDMALHHMVVKEVVQYIWSQLWWRWQKLYA